LVEQLRILLGQRHFDPVERRRQPKLIGLRRISSQWPVRGEQIETNVNVFLEAVFEQRIVARRDREVRVFVNERVLDWGSHP